MDDNDRRDVINALNREGRSSQQRILASLNSFKNWVQLALYVIFLKIRNSLETLWSWLRLVFA